MRNRRSRSPKLLNKCIYSAGGHAVFLATSQLFLPSHTKYERSALAQNNAIIGLRLQYKRRVRRIYFNCEGIVAASKAGYRMSPQGGFGPTFRSAGDLRPHG